MGTIFSKIWHGFLYGIGASLAWWLVFSVLGYTLYDQIVSDITGKPETVVEEQKASPEEVLKDQLKGKTLEDLDIPDASIHRMD